MDAFEDRLQWYFCFVIAFVAFCTYLLLEELIASEKRVLVVHAITPSPDSPVDPKPVE